jgi:protein TonB
MKTLFTISFFLFVANLHAQVVMIADSTASTSTDKPFTFVDVMPQFQGGDAALIKFLQQNIKYPAMERDNDIQGRVIVRFVIDEEGNVTDVETTRPVSPGLDREAQRVVKMLPKFTPGTQQGKAVKVYYNLPIVFKLDDGGQKGFDMQVQEKAAKDKNFKAGLNYLNAGDFKAAKKAFEKSAGKKKDGIVYTFIGNVNIRLGDKKEACEAYRNAINLGLKTVPEEYVKNCK